jgi:hypothetical protein
MTPGGSGHIARSVRRLHGGLACFLCRFFFFDAWLLGTLHFLYYSVNNTGLFITLHPLPLQVWKVGKVFSTNHV